MTLFRALFCVRLSMTLLHTSPRPASAQQPGSPRPGQLEQESRAGTPGGLKLRLPGSDPRWRAAILLAAVAMVLTVGGVAVDAVAAAGCCGAHGAHARGDMTLIVVASSIVVHGLPVTPLMHRYEARARRR